MARITVEDCIGRVPNRFRLVQIAAVRAKQIKRGSVPLLRSENREIVTSLREVAAGLIRPNYSELEEAEESPVTRGEPEPEPEPEGER